MTATQPKTIKNRVRPLTRKLHLRRCMLVTAITAMCTDALTKRLPQRRVRLVEAWRKSNRGGDVGFVRPFA
jgi:hypothetical protein